MGPPPNGVGIVIVPRSSASAASSTLALCAAVVVTMAVVFYFGASHNVFGGAERRFVLAVVAIVGIPYALILLAALTGRVAAACLMTFSAAPAYLLTVGWLALFLFVLSWEKGVVETLPLAAGIVQLLALIAAAFAWRRLPKAEKAVPRAALVFALPLVLAGGLGAFAYQAFKTAQAAPAVRAADDAAMDAEFGRFAGCLHAQTMTHGEAPQDARKLAGACGETAARMFAQTNYQILYTRAPPGPDGRHDRYTLCLQPANVPDSGFATFLSDASGMIAVAHAGDRSRTAVPCVNAIRATPTGLAKRFEYCMTQYWAQLGRREYSATLDPIRKALPACLDAHEPSDTGSGRQVEMEYDYDVKAVLNYTPTPRGEGEPGYWLYLHCSGTAAFAAIDARGNILNADLPEARAWLNQCQEADEVDPVALARAAGLRLPEGPATASRGARLRPPAPPQAPQFFGDPDLAARRTECSAQVSACASLGRELERAITLAGGNAARTDTLNDEQSDWLREARDAHVRACKAGVARSCFAEASLATYALDRDAGHVEEFYSLGCDGGDDLSCSYLAEIYSRGMPSTVPGIRSVRLMGQPEMKIPTGIADPKRPSIAKNLARAAELYRHACELGNREGCRLEAMTLQESAANRDDALQARANAIFVRECHRSDWSSCLFLARNATAAGGVIEGKSAEYWRAQTCLYGGDAYCEPASNGESRP